MPHVLRLLFVIPQVVLLVGIICIFTDTETEAQGSRPRRAISSEVAELGPARRSSGSEAQGLPLGCLVCGPYEDQGVAGARDSMGAQLASRAPRPPAASPRLQAGSPQAHTGGSRAWNSPAVPSLLPEPEQLMLLHACFRGEMRMGPTLWAVRRGER